MTIFYALLGIPLMLLCLSNIGNLLAHSFKFTYSRICCAIFRKHPETGIKPRKTIYRQSARENSVPNFGRKEESKLRENSFEEKEKPAEKVNIYAMLKGNKTPPFGIGAPTEGTRISTMVTSRQNSIGIFGAD